MASEYLQRTCASNGNLTKFTISLWLKRSDDVLDYQSIVCAGPTGGGGNEGLFFNTGDGALYYALNGASFTTSRIFRDTTQWMHIVHAVDTTQATESNRFKTWVNGQAVTWGSYPTQNQTHASMNVASGQVQRIGYHSSNSYQFYGSVSEIYFVDGQQLDYTVFGRSDATTGQWIPKAPATVRASVGSFGTNGYYLPFKNKTSATTLGYDYKTADRSSNIDWTLNNITTADANNGGVENSFWQMNSLATDARNTSLITDGGTKIVMTANGNTDSVFASSNALPKTGKWYFEVKCSAQSEYYGEVGIVNIDRAPLFTGGYGNSWLGDDDIVTPGHSIFYWNSINTYDGLWNSYFNSGTRLYSSTFSDPTYHMVAIDRDAGKLYWGRNGSWVVGNPSAGTGGVTINNNSDDWVIATSFWNSVGNITMEFNFGIGAWTTNSNTDASGIGKFQYTVPTNYKALCEDNMPKSAITNPEAHFKTILWSGNNAAARSITGTSFQPDLVILKNRSDVYNPQIHDAVRGASDGAIYTSSTATRDSDFPISSFNADGFTTKNATSVNSQNLTGNNYVAWCWKAGNGTTTLTGGDISVTASVNQPAGFSILKYNTGSYSNTYTVPHGLTTAPEFMIIKGAYDSTTYNFDVYHKYLSSYGNRLILNDTTAETSGGTYAWNGAAPSNTLITVNNNSGSYYGTNKNMIAYCWRSIPGYSKMGAYTYNNASDGTYVYTGFRPACVIVKNSDNVETWYIFDNARMNGTGDSLALLRPSSSATEATSTSAAAGTTIQFTATGFKFRDANPAGGELTYETRRYLFAAFAADAWEYSNAV